MERFFDEKGPVWFERPHNLNRLFGRALDEPPGVDQQIDASADFRSCGFHQPYVSAGILAENAPSEFDGRKPLVEVAARGLSQCDHCRADKRTDECPMADAP